jgi:hypothetical protein
MHITTRDKLLAIIFRCEEQRDRQLEQHMCQAPAMVQGLRRAALKPTDPALNKALLLHDGRTRMDVGTQGVV